MDKTIYRELKKVNIEKKMIEIRNNLRGDFPEKYVDIICYIYLALIAKDMKSISEINGTIESKIENETSQNYLKRLIKKDRNNIIKKISGQYSKEELEALILFAKPETFSETDMVSTPEGISNLAIELLDIKKDDVVLDLGSGINSFLIQSYVNRDVEKLNGVEINTESFIIGSIRSKVLGLEINNIQGNILSQDFRSIKANKVFSNAPLGVRWGHVREFVKNNPSLFAYFKNTKKTISGDWAYALSGYINQSKPGKTVVIMSNSGIWNKPDEIIRKELLNKGLIEGIISLPSNIFTFTSMELIMIIFSEGNKAVKMIDASQIYTKGRRLNTLEEKDIEEISSAYNTGSEISKIIDISEIKHQEYILNPKRYVKGEIEIKDAIELGDVIKSINRGSMITSKKLDNLISEEKTNYNYLRLKDIKEGKIEEDLSYIKELDESYDRYCVKNNDIIVSKTAPFKVALTKIEKDKKIVASGNQYFLEVDESKVNPVFLTNFLQSELGMQQLNTYSKGSVIKNISIGDLKKIQIPNLPLNEQNRLAKEINFLDAELIVLQRQIDILKDRRAKVIQEVI